MSTNDTTIPEGYKRCSICGKVKRATTEQFHKNSDSNDGLRAQCKQCRLAPPKKPTAPDGYKQCFKCKKVYPATLEHFHADMSKGDNLCSYCKVCIARYTKKYRAKNKIMIMRKKRKYQVENRERLSQKKEKYYRDHKAQFKAAKSRRRARELDAPGSHSADDIELQKRVQTDTKGNLRCWWCNTIIKGTYHVDHRIALIRGGSNDASNLVIACPYCNKSKHDKLPGEWNGRLL